MAKMHAVIQADDQSLSWAETDRPSPGDNELLVRISATAINRADLVQRRGGYPPPPGASAILGLECAGEVVATGPGCTRFSVGDRVCALLAGGGYAQYTTVDEGSAVSIPDGLSDAEAASLPEVYATAWLNLFMEAGLTAGEKVILHAGASGVGTAAIQLCRAFGASCFVTAGSADKVAQCLALGASAGSNRHDGPFLPAAREFAGRGGVDVILDPVGAGYLSDNMDLLAIGGRLLLIGLMGGTKDELDLARVIMKRARIIGSTLRARPLHEKAAVMSELESEVWPKIASGDIRPVIERQFAITEVERAHDLVASDATTGKVVLTVEH